MIGDETKKYKYEPPTEPKTVEPVKEYKHKTTKKKKRIEFRANDNQIFVDGVMHWFDPPPYNRDGVFFVPLEVLFDIVFNGEITRDGDKIIIERSL